MFRATAVVLMLIIGGSMVTFMMLMAGVTPGSLIRDAIAQNAEVRPAPAPAQVAAADVGDDAHP